MSPYILSITETVASAVRFDPQRGWRYCTEDSNASHFEFGSGKALATDGVVAVFQPQNLPHPVVVQLSNLDGKIVSYTGVPAKPKHIKLREPKERKPRTIRASRKSHILSNLEEAMRFLENIE